MYPGNGKPDEILPGELPQEQPTPSPDERPTETPVESPHLPPTEAPAETPADEPEMLPDELLPVRCRYAGEAVAHSILVDARIESRRYDPRCVEALESYACADGNR
jgi:hypothetical protein